MADIHPAHYLRRLVRQKRVAIATLLTGAILLTGQLAAATADALEGRWSGTFTIGQDDTRELIFTLHARDSGYTATLDLPAQASAGIQVDSVTLHGSEITMVVRAVRAEFYGTLRWSDDRTQIERIDGDWNQAGEYVAVTLRPQAH